MIPTLSDMIKSSGVISHFELNSIKEFKNAIQNKWDNHK